MELQWRKLDLHIEAQPMPEQYAKTRAWVVCNDCSAKTCVRFHWLGNKCAVCDSYNTNEMRLENGPVGEAAEGLHEEVRPRAATVTSTDVVVEMLPNPSRSTSNDIVTTDSALQNVQDVADSPPQQHSLTSRAQSPPINNNAASSYEFPTPMRPSPHTSGSPTNTFGPIMSNSTTMTALNSPRQAEDLNTMSDNEVEMTDVDADELSDQTPGEDEEDEASFWGDSIRPPNGWPNLSVSPSQWARSISPSSWRVGSPAVLAGSAEKCDEDEDESMGEESDTDDEENDDEENAGVEGDGEGEGEDEWELFGHR